MLSRLLSVFRRRRLERDLDDEIAGHLAMQEAEFRAAGMTFEAARSAAIREFGGVAQAKEDYRDRRDIPLPETFLRDARYALRGLARARASPPPPCSRSPSASARTTRSSPCST